MSIRFLILSIVFCYSISVKAQDSNTLLLVGEQISVKEKNAGKNAFTSVKAKYKVLKVIRGNFNNEFIEVLANPASLSGSKKEMLYLHKEDNGDYRLILSVPAYSKGEKKVYAFVGSKLSLERLEQKSTDGSMLIDNAYLAKYKIIQNVYGKLEGDTVVFEVYDHYGIPAFSNYDQVLLFVSEGDDGKLYHEKYLFNPVFQTEDGKWAGPYSEGDYRHEYNKNTTINPIAVNFQKGAGFSISDSTSAKSFFPEPYFRIEGNNAVPVLGNYVEDLVRLKFNGVLLARGYVDY